MTNYSRAESGSQSTPGAQDGHKAAVQMSLGRGPACRPAHRGIRHHLCLRHPSNRSHGGGTAAKPTSRGINRMRLLWLWWLKGCHAGAARLDRRNIAAGLHPRVPRDMPHQAQRTQRAMFVRGLACPNARRTRIVPLAGQSTIIPGGRWPRTPSEHAVVAAGDQIVRIAQLQKMERKVYARPRKTRRRSPGCTGARYGGCPTPARADSAPAGRLAPARGAHERGPQAPVAWRNKRPLT